MRDDAGIAAFVRALARERASAPPPPAPFVTISREAGAGGRGLAELLAAELSRRPAPLGGAWRAVDRSLAEEVAADPKLAVVLDALLAERRRSGLDDWASQLVARRSPQLKIDHRIFRAVRSAAERGRVIIVGRAGAFVTRDLPLGVHVRLVAPLGARRARFAELRGLDLARAERQMAEEDASRAALVREHFGRDVADPLSYHSVWNTGLVPLRVVAAAVVAQLEAAGSSVGVA